MGVDRVELFGRPNSQLNALSSLRRLGRFISEFPRPHYPRAQRSVAPESQPPPIEPDTTIFSIDPITGPSEIPPEYYLPAHLGADRNLNLTPGVINVQTLYRSQKPFYNRGVYTNQGARDGKHIRRGRFTSA